MRQFPLTARPARSHPAPPPPRRHHTRRAVALLTTAALTVAGALVGTIPADATTPVSTGALVNGGFEAGLTGWTVTSATGTPTAAKTGTPGHDGSATRLTHWADTAYQVTTRQAVTDLTEGWWTVSAWVKSGGALDATTLGLTRCGVPDVSTTTPITEQDDAWVRLAVSTYVVGGRCTVSIATNGPGGAWAGVDDVALEPGQVTRDVRGGDLSGLAKNEDLGANYAAADGTPGDAVQILADAGMNLGRLRVWVNPADGYNDAAHVVATAKRIKAAGMQLLVDFHYSDRWADPGAQTVPAAWASFTPAQLAVAVHDHTRAVLDALAAAGITADYVQVGNEINPGMLWPSGQTWDVNPSDGVTGAQWDNLASFLTAGAQAVREVSPATRVILHLTNINNGIGSLTWWFDEITARAVPFDVIGLSYYGYWHGSLADLQGAISTLSARYDRDVMVVETAYPFTLADDTPTWENVINLPSELVAGYPATPAGQAAEQRAVQDAVASSPGGRGLGTVYWEPAWTSVAGNGWDPADPASGNAWENQALFDFDGRLLPAAAELAPDAAAPDRRATSRVSLDVDRSVRAGQQPVARLTVGAEGGRSAHAIRPTGTLVVLDSGVEIARTTLRAADDGRVSVRLPALAVGTHALTAVYSGDTLVQGSTSAVTRLTVRGVTARR
jgi:arabinogalactan endo-1,4-beta-galactosidase